jgi:hypothetical protein
MFAHGFIIIVFEGETARCLFAVTGVCPKLSVIPTPSNIEAGDSPIAGIARGNKLRPMTSEAGHSVCEGFFALRERSLSSSSTNPSYVSGVMCNSLVINRPGWRNWQTRQT